MTLLQHHLLALSLIAVTTTTLGIFILMKGPTRFVNRLFVLYMISVAWWSITEFWSQFSPDELSAVLRLRAEYIGVSFIPTLFYHGTLVLSGIHRRREIALCYLGSLVFLVLIGILRHPLILPDAVPVAYLRYWGKAGPYYIVFLTFWISVVCRTLQTLWVAIRDEDSPLKRRQLSSLLTFSMFAYIGGIPEFAMKYGVKIPVLNPYGLYLIPLHIIGITYAIVQFRLFDIHVAIRKSVVYSLLVTLLTVGYFGIVYGFERVFQTAFGYRSLGVSLIAFSLMALLFQPLRVAVQRIVDHLVFRTSQQGVAKKLEMLEERAREGDRYKTVATLSAGIAHELKNPLAAIQTFLDFFPQRGSDPKFRQQFQDVVGSEVKRLRQVAQGLLDFSKPQSPQMCPVDLKAVLEDVLALTKAELAEKSLSVHTSYTHNGAVVQGDAAQLKQAFLNLILNARDATEKGGMLTVFTASVNGHMEVHVADTGCGIHPKDLPHLFEPFFSRKANGNGLGLSIVHSIIREHRGSISVQSTPGRGTTFIVKLPL